MLVRFSWLGENDHPVTSQTLIVPTYHIESSDNMDGEYYATLDSIFLFMSYR
jgi:hypothetical protein